MKEEQKQAINELAELLHKNNLSEIEYDVEGVHLRVVGPAGVVSQASVPVPVVAAPENKTASVAEADYIRSPMVGIAYLSKELDAEPFVHVGDTVSVGQTVCMIEAMKTYNPIKADKAGTVLEVLIETGSPVEYNQPLFRIG